MHYAFYALKLTYNNLKAKTPTALQVKSIKDLEYLTNGADVVKNNTTIVYSEYIYSDFSETGQLLAKNLSMSKSRLNILSQGIVGHVG